MREVAVVAHTHWDREWYQSFEEFRARLVLVLDELVDLLEAEPRLTHFHLDGQVALVEDYLDVRRDQAQRVARLVGEGRLAIGPWYCLMDEFAVSAETIVRNLQLGRSTATRLGGICDVGYLPDMFGHISQMPQILRGAGIEHAVVWRGVPATLDRTGFVWSSPDGSNVRAEYLPTGYGAGGHLPRDVEAFVGRLSDYERELGVLLSDLRDDDPLLVLNGGDHHGAQSHLGALVEAANAAQDRFRVSITDLRSYLAEAPHDELSVLRGELRSNTRAPLLSGVLSSRVDLKQAAAAVESALERTAEPLAALWLAPEDWPAGSLDRAWLEVIRNSAHDSICGCSADEVGRAVLSRYDTACTLAATVTTSVLGIASIATASSGHMVLNPSAGTRSGLVEVESEVTGIGGQALGVTVGGTTTRTGRGRDLARILAELTAEGWIGESCPIVGVGISPRGATGPVSVSITSSRAAPADLAVGTLMAEVWGRSASVPEDPLRLTVTRLASIRTLVRACDVPGYGWALLRPGATEGFEPVSVEDAGGAIIVDNGAVRVEVDANTGSLRINGIRGMNTIREELDDGDTYNFSPLDGVDAVDSPNDVHVEVIERGPLRAVVRTSRTYLWGVGRATPVCVVSDVEVRCAEPVVRVTTSFDNTVRNHRVRAVFPLPARAAETVAECAFATVRRPVTPPGRDEEWLVEAPPDTFPSRRFVSAGAVTVLHQGLIEYGVVDDGQALALTLLRGTGIISKPALATRRTIAGPPLELRDAQMPGPQAFTYAVALDCADPWSLAETLWSPLIALRAHGGGPLADSGSRLDVDAGSAVVSSLRRNDGQVELRVFNPGNTDTRVRIPGGSGTLVDLDGREIEDWDGSFPLGGWKFATARLDGPATRSVTSPEAASAAGKPGPGEARPTSGQERG